jgi:hypothetical protein
MVVSVTLPTQHAKCCHALLKLLKLHQQVAPSTLVLTVLCKYNWTEAWSYTCETKILSGTSIISGIKCFGEKTLQDVGSEVRNTCCWGQSCPRTFRRGGEAEECLVGAQAVHQCREAFPQTLLFGGSWRIDLYAHIPREMQGCERHLQFDKRCTGHYSARSDKVRITNRRRLPNNIRRASAFSLCEVLEQRAILHFHHPERFAHRYRCHARKFHFELVRQRGFQRHIGEV